MPSRIYRIYKEIPGWSGTPEEVSNVYRYSHPGVGNQVSQEVATATLNALLDVEKTIHANFVNFVRGESANVNALDGIQRTDVVVDWTGEQGLGTASLPLFWTPETVVMAQIRVGKKRWLRKFLHTFDLGTVPGQDGVRFNFDASGGEWDAHVAYGESIWSLAVTVGGNTEDVIYEAGNGTPATEPFAIDDRIRNHDINY